MTPHIIYQDEGILVLNKPSGMVVNKADTTKGQETLQEWIEEKFKVQNLMFGVDSQSDFFKRSGIVHRLDKETSGVLLVAKTPIAFENLQKQFKERVVKKTYLALIHGQVSPESGEINVPVGRLPWNRKRFGVVSEGKESTTKYQVLSIKYLVGKREPLSLLELYPKTGRTHQIRVHLKYINHPIFSDPLYAGRKTAREDRKLLPRIFLHAAKISFVHPTSAEKVTFEASLPKELSEFINNLIAL